MAKSHIVGLLLVLGVGFLVLRSGDEPSDGDQRGGESESATDTQFQPREPTFLAPRNDYGIADRSDPRSPPSAYDRPSAYRQQYDPQAYPNAYRSPTPYDGQERFATNGYRFRPLGERERQRIQSGYPDQYPSTYYPTPEIAPRPTAPGAYSTRPWDRQPRQENYSFRPLNKSEQARERWRGPYPRPGWDTDRSTIDPWTAPPDPQWGSTPPAQRMYPNLNRRSGRRLTAR